MAVCDMKSFDLTSGTFKILGVHLFYNKTLQNEMNFLKAIVDIQSVFAAVENAESNPCRSNYHF